MVDDTAESSEDSADALVQFTEKLVEVTMIMRTSSGSPNTTEHSGDASDSGSGSSSEWGTLQRCRRQRHWQVPSNWGNDTGAVQGDEPAIQKRQIIHAVGQGQVPNITKTDKIPQAQFMPRRGTTNSCAETVPNAQEVQIGMLQRSAVRERSGGYANCEGQARAIHTRRMQQWRTALRSSARRTQRAGARRELCMLNDSSSAKVEFEA